MNAPSVANDKPMRYVLIRLTFVAPGFDVGILLDRVTRQDPIPSTSPRSSMI